MKKIKEILPTSGTNLGGGYLESKRNPGKFQKFTKNKKQKRILIGSIIGVILLIGGIYLYRTYALYEEKKEFNVLKGQVPDFSTLTVKYVVEGVETSTIPSKDSGYTATITCSGVTGATWDDTNGKVSYSTSDLTSKEVTCTVTFNRFFSNYLINLSNSDGSIVKEIHEETIQTESNATIDYRYIGADPKNYVCLEESGSCTEDNLYRIIGVIPTQSSDTGAYENRVKLIKATSYGSYAWSGSNNNNNNWEASTLNTTTLNQTYWNSISSYQKYIGDTKWYLGASVSGATEKFPSRLYSSEERGTTVYNSGRPTWTVTKIGLMYPSDYAYATAGGTTRDRSSCLSSSLFYWPNYSDCLKNDWIYYSSVNQLTLTPVGGTSNILSIYSNGRSNQQGASAKSDTRPVFNLKANTIYKSGDGSKTFPYKIKIG